MASTCTSTCICPSSFLFGEFSFVCLRRWPPSQEPARMFELPESRADTHRHSYTSRAGSQWSMSIKSASSASYEDESALGPQRFGGRWNIYDCGSTPLDLNATLACGQAFRWRRDARGVWWGVIEGTAVAVWQAEGSPESPLCWQTFPEPDHWELLANYFRLDVDLNVLYDEWRRAEPRIVPAIEAFRGLRVLRQPPEECFFAFQCAACNTVVKIERSVAHLAARYGRPI